MYNYRTCNPGYCLSVVWQAYKDNGARVNGSWPTAWDAWVDSPGKHEGDRNPPAGVPVYLGQRGGYNGHCGDVMISNGDGTCVATDWPYNGVINICTIDERLAQTGRPYMGWTDNILGYPINWNGEGEDDMTQEQYDNINRQLGWIVNTLGAGGADPGVIPEGKTVLGRVINIDQQVTGADDFDQNVGPSVAGRVIDIQQNVDLLVDAAADDDDVEVNIHRRGGDENE